MVSLSPNRPSIGPKKHFGRIATYEPGSPTETRKTPVGETSPTSVWHPSGQIDLEPRSFKDRRPMVP
jgi:hypothetical protein